MSRTATPADPLAQLSFELDGFQWAGEERLEVSGRWFGVRGRRFVRPTLTLRAGGRRRRLIAVLEHKPWAAVEDGAWTAAFAWRGAREDITAARLEVAPDVVLELPPPGEASPGTLLQPRPRKRPAAPPPAPPEEPPAAPAAEASPPAPDPGAPGAAHEEGERGGRERAEAEIAAVRQDAERRLAEAEQRIEAL